MTIVGFPTELGDLRVADFGEFDSIAAGREAIQKTTKFEGVTAIAIWLSVNAWVSTLKPNPNNNIEYGYIESNIPFPRRGELFPSDDWSYFLSFEDYPNYDRDYEPWNGRPLYEFTFLGIKHIVMFGRRKYQEGRALRLYLNQIPDSAIDNSGNDLNGLILVGNQAGKSMREKYYITRSELNGFGYGFDVPCAIICRFKVKEKYHYDLVKFDIRTNGRTPTEQASVMSKFDERKIFNIVAQDEYGFSLVNIDLSEFGYYIIDGNYNYLGEDNTYGISIAPTFVSYDDYAILPEEPIDPYPPYPEGKPNVTLYYNSSEKIALSKALKVIETYQLIFHNTTSIIDPVIDIRTKRISEIVRNANYMYIDMFDRYYFINNIEVVRTDLIRIYGHVDVLSTYEDDILNLPAMIARNQFSTNQLVEDKLLPFESYSYWDSSFISARQLLDPSYDDYSILVVIASNCPTGPVEENPEDIEYIYGGVFQDNDTTDTYPDTPTVNFSFKYLNHNFAPTSSGALCVVMTKDEYRRWWIDNKASQEKQSLVMGVYAIPNMISGDKKGKDALINLGFTERVAGNIKYGYTLSGDGGLTAVTYTPTTTTYQLTSPKSMRLIDVDCPYESYRDMPPYVSYLLILPFYGSMQLESDWYNDSRIGELGSSFHISVDCVFDWSECTIAYYISVNYILRKTVSASFGTRIPLVQSNLEELQAQKQAARTTMLSGVLTSAIGGVAASFLTMNPFVGVVGGTIGAVTSGTQYNATLQRLIARGDINLSNSTWLAMQTCPYAVITRFATRPTLEPDDEYASLYGLPLQDTRVLNTCRGFTVVDEVHIESMTCTSEESDEIERLLKRGVILPKTNN